MTMDTIAVFVGPTLAPRREPADDAFTFLPPAAAGDIYKAARQRPRAIALIDGRFETTMSPWHKELLWVLSEGIPLFGAASMGALRAAELASHGMIGVGQVFEAFRDHRLEDDDEVTILHGPEEAGYLPLSEAMVNIRATLHQARSARVIGSLEAERLIAVAKRTFYKQRSYQNLLAGARGSGVSDDTIQRLNSWLPGNTIDAKRDDALRLLHILRHPATHASTSGFAFPGTKYWREFISWHAASPSSPSLP
jgi:hypothetical protein